MSLEQFTQMTTASATNEQAQAKNTNYILSGFNIFYFKQ